MLHVKKLAIRESYTFQATQAKSEESELNIYTTQQTFVDLLRGRFLPSTVECWDIIASLRLQIYGFGIVHVVIEIEYFFQLGFMLTLEFGAYR